MNGCFDFLGGNTCLWILIILLIICLCKSGCLNGLFNSCYCLPVALALICCFCGKGDKGLFGYGGGCCK
ncbi:MAG: chorion class high-cysteine HCB protein 13 [Clostridia bacterium]|nr:chorion class high-cysteine HCB protein 13 [Clostridia bacterium]